MASIGGREFLSLAIYLDSNVVVPWRTFAELDWLALSIVATQLGQAVIVPALVADEAAGRLERRLAGYIEAHDQAVAQLARHFGQPVEAQLDPNPDVDEAICGMAPSPRRVGWHSALAAGSSVGRAATRD